MTFLTDPVGWWVQPFGDYAFMREALVAGLITSVVAGLVGTWVVLRNMSFLAEALGHGVLPGVAIALLVDGNTSIGALLAALALLGAVQAGKALSPLPAEATIGVVYIGFLALAIVIMSSGSGSYAGDLDRFLFGSILGISASDLVRQGVIAAVAVVAVLALHRPLLAIAFNRTQAHLWGMRPRVANAALMVLLAMAVVVSYQSVGSLLVFAMLVAPAATASLLVGRVWAIMTLAVVLGAGASVVGLLVSYHHGTAAGGSIVLVLVSTFVLALAFRRVAQRGPSWPLVATADD